MNYHELSREDLLARGERLRKNLHQAAEELQDALDSLERGTSDENVDKVADLIEAWSDD